jgi:hypothetical protein
MRSPIYVTADIEIGKDQGGECDMQEHTALCPYCLATSKATLYPDGTEHVENHCKHLQAIEWVGASTVDIHGDPYNPRRFRFSIDLSQVPTYKKNGNVFRVYYSEDRAEWLMRRYNEYDGMLCGVYAAEQLHNGPFTQTRSAQTRSAILAAAKHFGLKHIEKLGMERVWYLGD